MQSPDPVVSGNRLRVRGPGAAIRVDGGDVTASIMNNEITVTAVPANAQPQAGAPIFSMIPVPTGSRPQAIVSAPDGAIWFGTLTKLFKLTADGKMSETPLPSNLTTSGRATVVQFLTFGPDGNLWAPYNRGNVIWSMTHAGEFTIYAVPTPGAWPRNITSGPDGTIWFTDEQDRIGSIRVPGGAKPQKKN